MYPRRPTCRQPVLAAVVMALALILAPGAAFCAEKVSIRLIWVPQAQFAGVYMAQDAGIYKRYGLEVEAKAGGPGIDPIKDVTDGQSDFAVAWLAPGLEARGKGAPIYHLAQVVQRSSLLLISLKNRGIKTVKDLNKRRVGMWGGHLSVAPNALFKREKISVIPVLQNVSVAPLLRDAVDAASAMRYNEYHQLYQAGVDYDQLVVFDFAKLGLNFPEDAIFTLESTWKTRPEVCRKLVKATLEGWRMCLARPEEALQSVMRRVREAQTATNVSQQRWMLKVMLELITHRVGREDLGSLSLADYHLVNQVLWDQGFISSQVPLAEFAVPAWR